MVTLIPIMREILIRERVTIVHGHAAFSSLGHDALFVGKLLDLKVNKYGGWEKIMMVG